MVLGPHLARQVDMGDLPRACTPASVRPATVSSYVSRDRVTVRSASSISPCTVRRPPACLAHPENSLPSYERSSR
ncbi:hypothetical protein STENM327S_04359 [Streptomyces tendae]